MGVSKLAKKPQCVCELHFNEHEFWNKGTDAKYHW